MIPYGKQQISREDIQEVLKALESDWITQGPLIETFEKALAENCQSQFVVVFSSGTAALHAACAVANIKDHEVITSPLSFVASANCALYNQAHVTFADVHHKTAQINWETLAPKITSKTKAIIPVDLCGQPGDLPKIFEEAKKKNLLVIRDAAHSFGAQYQSNKQQIPVGSQHAHMTCLSFHPVKSITTGEGGAVTTNDETLYQKLLEFRHHGICKDPNKFKNKEFKEKLWYHEMQSLGFNYRITDMQCALGLSQLKTLKEKITARQKVVRNYQNQLKDIVSFLDHNLEESAHHILPIQVPPKVRDALMKNLQDHGIGSQLHYIPIYRQPYYQKLYNIDPKNFPASEAYFKSALSIPVFPDLTVKQQEFIIQKIKDFLC